jgi:hypothetical protein
MCKLTGRGAYAGQAACLQVVQEQSSHTQRAHWSPLQFVHEQVLWLHVGQLQSAQSQTAQLSEHPAHSQRVHSS